PLCEPDAEVIAQVKSVSVDGLPQFWDEDRVKEHLKKFGEIEKVVLSRIMPTAKQRDFGFINFASLEQALACIEVRLANPLPKSQEMKGGLHGGFPIGHTGIGIRTRPGDLTDAGTLRRGSYRGYSRQINMYHSRTAAP
ncbi:hypothetical protein KI387_034286, partial [Taxus chinensis]